MSQASEPDPILDRFLGTVLGAAAGDALGATLEFEPPSLPDALVTEMVGGGWLGLSPGEWTDDTQMSICVMESLLAREVFDPDDIASRFVEWLRSQPKDVGNHTRSVLQAIADGASWESASLEVSAANPESAGNGSLMRCAPLSLFFAKHAEVLTELSPVLSRITHAHPDCEWACVFVNVLLTELVNGVRVIDAIETAYESLSGASNELKDRIGAAMAPGCATESTGYVLDTLEVALWVFLHTNSLEEAVVAAINRGGDADTVGSITGALAGARYGARAIPPRWLNSLKGVDMLCRYADGLYALALA